MIYNGKFLMIFSPFIRSNYESINQGFDDHFKLIAIVSGSVVFQFEVCVIEAHALSVTVNW